MKLLLSFLMAVAILITPVRAVDTLTDDAIAIDAPSACLLEVSTGEVIYEKDAHTPRHIASVTKVMTLLLIMEAIEDGTIGWDTPITASSTAAGMGGSQIWLEEGETMTVAEMVKCITVVSANDCSVAMAEHLKGSEAAFAAAMNERAAELGLKNTHFVNCTGLFDDPDHYSSAYDVAVLARELISHEAIKAYTTIWTDTARSGEFGLSNTNKLIRYFDGATGLKTGFTDGAMYCLAATAEREGVEYAAVVLGCDTSQHRFDSAKALLNYAFANYTVADLTAGTALPPVAVELGKADCVQPVWPEGCAILLERSRAGALEYQVSLAETVEAPVRAGDPLGTVRVCAGDRLLAELTVTAGSTVERMTLWDIFKSLCLLLLCG